MGGSPKTVYVPPVDKDAAAAASYVAPAAQQSPTARAQQDASKGASAMASGLGFGGTVLTSGSGLMEKGSTTTKALLGA